MTHPAFPLWDTPDLVTYTEVEEYRNRVYAQKGPKLVAHLTGAILAYVEDEHLTHLERINTLVVTLAALNPAWFEFSVEVFKTCFLPSQTPPKLLKSLFDSTVKQLARAA